MFCLIPIPPHFEISEQRHCWILVAGGVSAHFGFSFGQFLDFLLGWLGADIADDDLRFKPDGPPLGNR